MTHTVQVLVNDLRGAVEAMVGQARRAEHAARWGAGQEPISPEAASRLFREMQQLRETAEGVASLLAELPR